MKSRWPGKSKPQVALDPRLSNKLLTRVGGDRAATLLQIGWLWRTQIDRRDSLASAYSKLLLDVGDWSAAEHVLLRATVRQSSAELEGLLVRVLFHSQREWSALQRLENALQRFAIDPNGELRRAAMLLFEHSSTDLPGWVGITPGLGLCGQLRSDDESANLLVESAGFGSWQFSAAELPIKRDRSFQIRLPTRMQRAAALSISSQGRELLGGGLSFPPNAELDGGVSRQKKNLLQGWAQFGWDPLRPVKLKAEDENGASVYFSTERIEFPDAPPTFTLDLNATGIRGNRISISAYLPDRSWQLLPDAPFFLSRAVGRHRPESSAALAGRRKIDRSQQPIKANAGVCVIVPVYRGYQETLNCLESVLATLPAGADILVVDDATPEAGLATALDAYATQGRIRLLRNSQNLGFVVSVNRALATLVDQDAVLLNSDTVVFGDWLQRLQASAHSADDIGTATPFSSDGTIVSYPASPPRVHTPDDARRLDQRVRQKFGHVTVDIPVAVGFCMYLRRDCLQQTGALDEALFGIGYGEESDFCMRARALGWRHVLAADVYVYHAGAGSFGKRRAALLKRSARLINLRHPGYDTMVARFIAEDPIGRLRRQLDEDRLLEQGRPVVLLVTFGVNGGVDRHVVERSEMLRAQGMVPLVLCQNWINGTPVRLDSERCVLVSRGLSLQHLIYKTATDFDALTSLLGRLNIDHVEIHHFLGLDEKVLEHVCKLPIPRDVYIHDYVWICPRITLVDHSGRYCGEPALKVCEQCVKKNGVVFEAPANVGALRRRSARWLSSARRVIAPTQDACNRLRRYFPRLSIDVVPWQTIPGGLIARGSALNEWSSQPEWRQANGASRPVRIAVLGAIGPHKGYEILLRCARHAALRKLPIEFVVIGYTQNDRKLMLTGNVQVTGRFEEGEAGDLLYRERPDLVFLPSVFPETWCYTLTEAIRAGFHVAAFDLGGIAERLREANLGTLFPLNTSANTLNDFFLSFAEQKSSSRPIDRGDESPRHGLSKVVNQV